MQSRQEPPGCEGADDTDADDAAEVPLLEPLQRRPQTAERFGDCPTPRTRALNLLTRRATLGFSVGAIAMMACGRDPSAAGSTERADLEAVFAENGLAGTFVLYDVAADHLTLVDGKRARRRCVPAAAFQIATTVIRADI